MAVAAPLLAPAPIGPPLSAAPSLAAVLRAVSQADEPLRGLAVDEKPSLLPAGLRGVRAELRQARALCWDRGLVLAAQWAAEVRGRVCACVCVHARSFAAAACLSRTERRRSPGRLDAPG